MDVMDKIRAGMKDVKTPSAQNIVYKDECMFSYDTPYSPGGIAVNLSTWQGFSDDYIGLDFERSTKSLYLLQKWKSIPKTQEEEDAELAAIKASATEGSIVIGTSSNKTEKEHWILVMPERTLLPYPNPDVPMVVSQACDAVIAHSGSRIQEGISAYVEDFEAKESKYARALEQVPTEGKKIPSDPKMWKCFETAVTENLWMNLSTGFIGSGRKQWDGSGGNGASERHFEATGSKYPLVVKLGTITPHGADVFSYAPDENDMVLDPLLSEHLAHWGIDIMQVEKTEKTMAELQVTKNFEHDWSKITEEGEDLEILSGPGLVGIANLGNSCYVNSVMQCLFSVPEVQSRYPDAKDALFRSAPENPADDFASQMAKFGTGLLSDRYAGPPADDGPAAVEEVCVRPGAFKSLVGRGHPEFSTGRQQDAADYLQHFLQQASKFERIAKDRLPAGPATADLFTITYETRIECLESHQVRYDTKEVGNIVNLIIPKEAAVGYKEYQDKKRAKTESDDVVVPAVPQVPFAACLNGLVSDEVIPDFNSPATKHTGLAKKTLRFLTFPKYLVVKMSRYYYSENWEPLKMEVEVTMPEDLDLEPYRAQGRQEGEVEMAEVDVAAEAAAAAPEINMEMVQSLMNMGFSENGCKRAVTAVGQNGIEAASEWIFGHMEDSDFNDPLPAPGAADSGASGSSEPSAELIGNLTMLGFTDEQARAALLSTGNSPERGAEWLFSRMDNMDAAVAEALAAVDGGGGAAAAAADAGPVDDGPGKYSLFGIVSHLGKNTGCGHYVAHVKKNGRWVIFNDRKVGLSKAPPLDVGYMYFYKRNE
eukprot:m.332262 g.332262  ORF g.332262 m.332262 type:complete len:822 (-) comp27727_c1_seq35:2829-5294(-)